jgi:hypothetical protein
MNITEIENSLPYGFHDAEITNIEIDYPAKKALLTLNIPMDYENNRMPLCKKCVLTVDDIILFVIEPPNHLEDMKNQWLGLWIDKACITEKDLERFSKAGVVIPEEYFYFAFFYSIGTLVSTFVQRMLPLFSCK